jgi:hypothetical protein
VSVIVRQIQAAPLQLAISLRRDTEGVRDRSQMAETLSRSVLKGGCQFQISQLCKVNEPQQLPSNGVLLVVG